MRQSGGARHRDAEPEGMDAMIRFTNRTTGEVVEGLQLTVDRNGVDSLVDVLTATARRDGRQEVHVQSRHEPTGATAEFWLVVSEVEPPPE